MGKPKSLIKVFMVHRWDMAEVQENICHLLSTNSSVKILDKSYTASSPAEKNEYIQKYACGQMQESDIIIVLPQPDEECLPKFKEGEDYLPFFSCQPFARNHGLRSDSINITELKTLMYDSCNNVPVLVLGWSRECAEYLANILRSPDGIGNRYYDAGRIYAMGIDEIKNSEYLVEKIIDISKSGKRKSI
jgi:hypothetical protein